MNSKNVIAVLYYNKPSLTTSCLESVLKYYPPELCYAFDNGSDKSVFEIIKKRFPDIHHHCIENNNGYSGGFNEIMRYLFSKKVESVLFLTNDTLIYPDVLESCVTVAQENKADIVAPCIVYASYPDEIDSIGGFFDYSVYTLNHFHKRDLPVLLEPNRDYVPGTAFWLSCEAFETLGGMDESYHTYWEDADFSFRAHKKGIKIARAYTAKILHKVGKTCHKKPLYTMYYFQRNRIVFCKAHLPPRDFMHALVKIKSELGALKNKWLLKNDRQRLKYLEEIAQLIETF